MPWAALIPLIVQYGLPFAEKIWAKATSGKDVVQADWDELSAIAGETAQYHLAQAASKLGIATTDPRVIALASLIK